MKPEEQITLKYLKNIYGNDVIPTPEHNDPPDILVNLKIAVEVRRLNQNIFKNGNSEGVEKFTFPLQDIFVEVLESFNNLYDGRSYFVLIDYQRPLELDSRKAKQVKREMKSALQEFLNSNVSIFPYKIQVNPEIAFSFLESSPVNGSLFRVGGSAHLDTGGMDIEVYAKNIHLCISEKSLKISNRLKNYREWWLYLVDYIGFGLSPKDSKTVIQEVGNTGNFDKVVLLDYLGQNVLITMSK